MADQVVQDLFYRHPGEVTEVLSHQWCQPVLGLFEDLHEVLDLRRVLATDSDGSADVHLVPLLDTEIDGKMGVHRYLASLEMLPKDAPHLRG